MGPMSLIKVSSVQFMISKTVPLVSSREERLEKCLQVLLSVKNVAASQSDSCLQVLKQSLVELLDVVFYKIYQHHKFLGFETFTRTTPSTVLLGNIQSTERKVWNFKLVQKEER